MSCFPMCVELAGKRVILVGAGEQIREKLERLAPFGAELFRKNMLTPEDLEPRPAFVVVGDLDKERSRCCSQLCMERMIPVNVVDQPELCSFIFPALISRGKMTVSVSTAGAIPAAAVWMREQIEELLPADTEEILDWLTEVRGRLRETSSFPVYRGVLKELTIRAFAEKRPLSGEECAAIMETYGLK